MRLLFLPLALLLAVGPASARGGPPRTGAERVPPLQGAYTGSTDYPRVFTTRAELDDIAHRVGRPGSFSARNFAALSALVARDIASKNDWDAAYSGCKINDYLYAFSFTDAHSSEVDEIRSDMHLPANVEPPIGAAIVASRDALYAALVRAGARADGGPSAADAAALSRKILLAWAEHGFRDGDQYRSRSLQFCDDEGRFVPAATSAVGLQVSRGVLYSVDAEDLLESMHALRGEDRGELEHFHRAMYDLVRNARNFSSRGIPCNRFGNHQANSLAMLLAVARLLDDRMLFEAALYGDDPQIPVDLPWIAFFDRNVYGRHDEPNACYHNSGTNGLTSRPFFQTVVVAPGEIDDRFRNKDADQGIGYPMFSLERLMNAAQVLKGAGFEPYAYHGRHGQSIRMAVRYYACYGDHVGFDNVVSESNGGACPDVAQYVGKNVTGGQEILFGASLFHDPEIEAAARAAMKEPRVMDSDALFFGHWPD